MSINKSLDRRMDKKSCPIDTMVSTLLLLIPLILMEYGMGLFYSLS